MGLFKGFNRRKIQVKNYMETQAAHLGTDNWEKIRHGGMDAYNAEGDLWRDNKAYLDYLHDWYYCKLLLNNLTIPVKEILQASKPMVKLPISVEDKELYINKQLERLNILKILGDSLDDIIYDRPLVRYLTYDKDTEVFDSVPLITKDAEIKVIKKFDKIVGILFNEKFISIERLILGYDILVESDYENAVEINAKLINDNKDLVGVADEIKDELQIYQYFDIKTTFWYQSPLLYQIYLKDIMSQSLSIKDTLRQSVYTIAIQNSDNKKVINLSNIAKQTERALNSNDGLVLNQDPVNLVQAMTKRLMNSITVLGSIQDFNSITKLTDENDKEKRAQLGQEIDELKQQILNNLGIPQELAGTQMTSNRWEILSRSDRYLSAVTNILNKVTDVVKQVASSMLRVISGYDIEPSEIQYNLINSTNIQSQLSRNKVMALQENTQYLTSLLRDFSGVLQSGFVNVPQAIDELLTRIHRDDIPYSNSFKTKDEILEMLSKQEE